MNGTTAYLRVDQRINIYDCLHALMLPSGNDASIVLATAFGKWLYFSGDKGRKASQLSIPTAASSSYEKQEQPTVPVNFENGHEEYIKAFVQEMNR